MTLIVVFTGFATAGAVYYMYSVLAHDLPQDLDKLALPPSRATQVFSADGKLIGEFYLQRRIEVPFQDIPDVVKNAFVSAEDGRFWEHPGFDMVGIVRAARANFQHGRTRQGASTITQQVTRMILLSNERTYIRKVKELILSVRVESQLSKQKILEMYLNRIYLGHGAYGVQAAAEVYFGKDAKHLTTAEAAILAGLPQAPSRYSPHLNLKSAVARQHYVLERMVVDQYITATQAAAARTEALALVDPKLPLNHLAAPYFVEHVRKWATVKYGHRTLFHSGLRIHTTLDMGAQHSAEAAVRAGLEALDRRIGFRGPVGHIEATKFAEFVDGPARPFVHGLERAQLAEGAELMSDVTYLAVVTQIDIRKSRVNADAGPLVLPLAAHDAKQLLSWRGEPISDRRNKRPRLTVGDLIPVRLSTGRKGAPAFALSQEPDVEAALVSIDPRTGRIAAMVGGYSFTKSQLNRSTQSHRQIGSAIKPFIYMTALEKGVTHLDVIPDKPIRLRGRAWPRNYNGSYGPPMTLRTALAKSVNTVSVRLLSKVGVSAVIDNMHALGITSHIPRGITIALGTPDLTLIEVVAGYAGIANGGMRVTPRFVDFVETSGGEIVADYRNVVPSIRAIPATLAFVIADLMKVVVQRGTGRRVQELGRPAAAKTGTSHGHRDAWFLGYTTDLVAGVWVGRDDFTPIGAKATGGSAALPIWLQYMKTSHPKTPNRDFPVPDGLVFVRANEITGAPAPPGAARAAWVPMLPGTVPPRFARRARRTRFENSTPLLEPPNESAVAPRSAEPTKLLFSDDAPPVDAPLPP